MAEYIERSALLDDIKAAIENRGMGVVVGQTLRRFVSRQPAADVAPVRHGKWIVTKEFNDVLDMDVEKYTCSACGEYRLTASGLSHATNYCPNCGAKMDADE